MDGGREMTDRHFAGRNRMRRGLEFGHVWNLFSIFLDLKKNSQIEYTLVSKIMFILSSYLKDCIVSLSCLMSNQYLEIHCVDFCFEI